MRECEFCVAPRAAPARVYEAIAAQCVPVVVSDAFVFPFGLGAALRATKSSTLLTTPDRAPELAS